MRSLFDPLFGSLTAPILSLSISGTQGGRPDFYANSAASGGGDGSILAPFNTLAALTAAMGSNKRAQLTGRFRETLTPSASGQTFLGDGIISGATVLSSWTSEVAAGRENFLDGSGSTPLSYFLFNGNGTDGKGVSNLTATGTPTFVAGPDAARPNAVDFSGTSQNYQRASASLPAGFPGKAAVSTAFTAVGWVKFDVVAGGLITKNDSWSIWSEGGRIVGGCWDSGGLKACYSNAVASTGVWTHVALRLTAASNGTVELYINGVKQADTQTLVGALNTNASVFAVGGPGFWGNLNGQVAEVAVFTSALLDAQIADIHVAGLSGTVGNTVYYATQTTDPLEQVFFDATDGDGMVDGRLFPAASKGALATGKYWWDDPNDRLYIFDNPAGHTVEVSTRDHGVRIVGKTDITIGVTIEKAKLFGIYGNDGCHRLRTTSACKVMRSGRDNFTAGDDVADQQAAPENNDIVVDGEFAWAGMNGVSIFNQTHRARFVGISHHNCQSNTKADYTANVRYVSDYTVGLETLNRANDVVLSGVAYAGGCNLAGAKIATGDRGFGLWLDTPGSNSWIEDFTSYDNALADIHFEYGSDQITPLPMGSGARRGTCSGHGGGALMSRRTNGAVFEHIVCTGTGTGIGIWVAGGWAEEGLMTDNIVRRCTATGYAKNFSAINGGENDGVKGSGNEYHDNDFGPEAPGFLEYGEGVTFSTYAAVEAASSGAFHNNGPA